MKHYGVKEVARLSNISERTLHYYDEIGLLKPSIRRESGYRYYEEKELLRLLQILYYKELDFPLKKIKQLMDTQDFDLLKALEGHKSALQDRQKRLSHLLHTLDQTIKHLKKGDIMTDPGMLYEGLPKDRGTKHREEAIENWGKEAIEQSETELLKLGKVGFQQLKADFEQINTRLFELREKNPQVEEGQETIARHYQIIRQFWGTQNKEDKQAEAYAGLGELYVYDQRYTIRDGDPQPDFAHFLKIAMGHFANTQLTD